MPTPSPIPDRNETISAGAHRLAGPAGMTLPPAPGPDRPRATHAGPAVAARPIPEINAGGAA